MIKDGNYYSLDFDSIKSNLIEVFCEFCGEKYRDVITRRVNNINYYPSIANGETFDYYNQFMDRYIPEIQKEFFKTTGIRPSKLRREALHKEGEGSPLLTALVHRKDSDNDRLLGAEGRQQVRDARDLCCKAFGIAIDDPDRYDKLLVLAKKLENAYDYISKLHPNDVLNDMLNYRRNLVANTRDMLLYLHDNNYIILGDHDLDLLENPTLSISDIGNLDVNGLIFSGTIESPGSYEAFTTKNIARLNSDDPQVQANGMLDVLRWIYRNTGYQLDILGLSPEELLDELYNEEPHSEKMIKKISEEFAYQVERYPQIMLSSQTADFIDNTRKAYSNYIYNGCHMSNDLDLPYYMSPDYIDNDLRQPSPDLNLVESQVFNNLDELLNVLLHEISHCMGFDIGRKTISGKRAISRCGLFNFVYQLDDDGRVKGDDGLFKDTALECVEENINERFTRELVEIYLSKFPNPFDPNDISYSHQSNCDSLYEFWDFMTDKFYANYRDQIIKHKIDNSYDIYYGGSMAYSSRKEEKFDGLFDKVNRAFKPNTFANSGAVDYHKMVKLGELIEEFRETTLPSIEKVEGITPKNMISKLKEIGDRETLLKIRAYRKRANAIVDEMLNDRDRLLVGKINKIAKKKNVSIDTIINKIKNEKVGNVSCNAECDSANELVKE